MSQSTEHNHQEGAAMTFEEWWASNRWCDKEKGEFIWNAATKAEREACAKVCDSNAGYYTRSGAEWCAEAIRARTP